MTRTPMTRNQCSASTVSGWAVASCFLDHSMVFGRVKTSIVYTLWAPAYSYSYSYSCSYSLSLTRAFALDLTLALTRTLTLTVALTFTLTHLTHTPLAPSLTPTFTLTLTLALTLTLLSLLLLLGSMSRFRGSVLTTTHCYSPLVTYCSFLFITSNEQLV